MAVFGLIPSLPGFESPDLWQKRLRKHNLKSAVKHSENIAALFMSSIVVIN